METITVYIPNRFTITDAYAYIFSAYTIPNNAEFTGYLAPNGKSIIALFHTKNGNQVGSFNCLPLSQYKSRR